MKPEIFDQTLRAFVKKKPFQPFIIELLDGFLRIAFRS